MAISDSSYIDITANGTDAILRKLTDDKAVLVYSEQDLPGANEFSGVIIDNSGATPSAGSRNAIWDGEDVDTNPDMWVISSTKIVLCCSDVAGDNDVKMRTVSISGNTMTEQFEATVEAVSGLDISMAMISGGTGLVAYRRASGSGHRLCRFTITGDTVTPGTPQTHSTDSVARPIGMCKLDGSRVFYMYAIAGNDIKFQIIDISSGISEGTPVYLDDGGRNREIDYLETARHPCIKVDTNKVFCHWKDDDDTPFSNVGVIVNCGIGTTINGFGTELEFISSSTANVTGSPDVLATDTIAVMYTDASLAGVIETVDVSGDTLTQNGDNITTATTPEEIASQHALVSTNLAAGEGVFLLQDDAGATTLSVSKITGLPATAAAGLSHSTGGIPGGII